jgi:hypothetical protein
MWGQALFLFVHFCELLLDPSCTDFMEGKPVVYNSIGWTMNNFQLMCHLINCHPSVLQDHAIDSLHVCISDGRGLVSGSFPMRNACATIFEPLDPFIDNLLRHDTVPILHWHPSMHSSTWYTFSPQKWVTALYFFWCKLNAVSMFMAQNSWQKWTSKVTPVPQGRRGVDHMYLVMPNQQYSQLQNTYLHCR